MMNGNLAIQSGLGQRHKLISPFQFRFLEHSSSRSHYITSQLDSWRKLQIPNFYLHKKVQPHLGWPTAGINIYNAIVMARWAYHTTEQDFACVAYILYREPKLGLKLPLEPLGKYISRVDIHRVSLFLPNIRNTIFKS